MKIFNISNHNKFGNLKNSEIRTILPYLKIVETV